MSQSSLVVPSRRLFLRNSGTAVLSGAAVALLADREAIAQSETMSQANLHDSAPTQFKEVGQSFFQPMLWRTPSADAEKAVSRTARRLMFLY